MFERDEDGKLKILKGKKKEETKPEVVEEVKPIEEVKKAPEAIPEPQAQEVAVPEDPELEMHIVIAGQDLMIPLFEVEVAEVEHNIDLSQKLNEIVSIRGFNIVATSIDYYYYKSGENGNETK